MLEIVYGGKSLKDLGLEGLKRRITCKFEYLCFLSFYFFYYKQR